MTDQPHLQARAAVDGTNTTHSRLLTDLANAVVRIHKRYYGKGPERARAHLSRNLLTVVLEGGLTRGEQALQEHGHQDAVLRARLAMQEAMESDFRVEIESLLYRSVRSFMSANDPGQDLQAEIFVLEPQESEVVDLEQPDVDSRADGLAMPPNGLQTPPTG